MSSPPGQQMSMLRHALTLSSITTLPEKIISGSSSRNQDLIWVTGHWPTDRRLHSKSSSPPSAPTIKITISSTSLRLDNFFFHILLVVPCNVTLWGIFFLMGYLLLKNIHPYETNWQWLITDDDDRRYEIHWKNQKKVKKILWIQIIVVSLYWGKETTPHQKYNT